jgi:baculoviral IAP repeat-containing protein 6
MFVLLHAASQLAVLQTGSSGLSGTINFGENLSSGFGALASLSTAMASAEQQLQQLQQKQMQLYKLQQQKQKLVQKLAETSKSVGAASSMAHYAPYASELFPPTPKNTPFFMTPPVTPPNESYHVFVGGAPTSDGPPTSATVAEKPPVAPTKLSVGGGAGNKKEKMNPGTTSTSNAKPVLLWPHSHNLFQPPPPQALVIERMHSGLQTWHII